MSNPRTYIYKIGESKIGVSFDGEHIVGFLGISTGGVLPNRASILRWWNATVRDSAISSQEELESHYVAMPKGKLWKEVH